MKFRLALIFFALFISSVFIVFYLKHYFFIQSGVDHTKKHSMTSQEVIDAINDKSINLYDYNAKILNRDHIYRLTHNKKITQIFHFWASWCDPCAIELPDLIRFAKKANHTNTSGLALGASAAKAEASGVAYESDIQIYLISLDTEVEGLSKFAKVFPEILSKDFFQVWDKENSLSSRYGVDKLPMTIILYSDGRIRIHNGMIDWSSLRL